MKIEGGVLTSIITEGHALKILLALLWGQLFLALLPTWMEVASYRYALVAAPLWVWMFVQTWMESSRKGGPGEPSLRLGRFEMLSVVLLFLPLLIIRLLENLDPLWRLPLWSHGFLVIVATLLISRRLFGSSQTGVILRTCLIALVLLPLPSPIEGLLTGNLTRMVSSVVGALLPMAGYPVDLAGNAIQVRGTILDVAEGCSGLRSFQGSVMAGLFLGEFYRLSAIGRISLIFGAILLAFLGNGARIFYLTTVAYHEGMEAEARVHSTAGGVALTFIYASIGLVAWLLSRQSSQARS